MPSLLVENISKSFPAPGGPRWILRDVSFEAKAGSTLCLVGPNGSGKTTLLKTMCSLLAPDEGRVRLGGLDVHRDPRAAKRRLGFASTEDHSFYGRLSARMNLWFYAQLFGLSAGTFEERLGRLAEELGLQDILRKPFRALSNGQKQRMLLARSLIHDPDVLLLDEPHQNLDPHASLRLRGLLKQTWPGRGKTLVVSTHHLDEALRVSDHWVVLSEGRAVFNGSVEAARAGRPGWTPETFFQEMTGAAPV